MLQHPKLLKLLYTTKVDKSSYIKLVSMFQTINIIFFLEKK